MTTIIVIDGLNVHKMDLGGDHVWPAPAGLSHDLAALLGWCGAQFEEATLILPSGGDRTRQDYANEITTLGWKTTTTDGGWFTCHHNEILARTVHIGIRDWLTEDPMFKEGGGGWGKGSVDLMWDLWRWYEGTGTHYRYTPGVAMLAALRNIPRQINPVWALRDRRDGAWWTPPTTTIRDLRVNATRTKGAPAFSVHQWDMRSAYLAAASAVNLPYRQLVQTNDPGTCGYYKLRGNLLHLREVGIKPGSDGAFWVTHPMLEFITRQRWDHEIVDSWTTDPGSARVQSGRILRPWAEKVRNAIDYNGGQSTARLLKMGYAQAIGLLAVQSGSVYRPDWRHMIIDEVRASILRRINRVYDLTACLPHRINVDSVYYTVAHDEPNPHNLISQIGEALGVGNEIGRMRYEGEVAA
jgi:hypothetical protein